MAGVLPRHVDNLADLLVRLVIRLFRVVCLVIGAVFCFEAGHLRPSLLDMAILVAAGCALLGVGLYWNRIFDGKKGK